MPRKSAYGARGEARRDTPIHINEGDVRAEPRARLPAPVAYYIHAPPLVSTPSTVVRVTPSIFF